MLMDPVVFIVIISVLGPIIGSIIGVAKKPSFLYMCNMLCFAAGVMLGISFLELIPESIYISSVGICVAGIIVGSLIMYGVDRIIPHIHPELCAQEQGCNLQRTSVYLILGIFLHNFPEGMAIAIGAVTESKVSLIIALAIAIHNIPEGICTSAPYYHATGNRLKSFFVSSSTAVPLLIGYLLARYIWLYYAGSAWFYHRCYGRLDDLYHVGRNYPQLLCRERSYNHFFSPYRNHLCHPACWPHLKN
jgi:ZIP family zinc transporter